MSNNLHVSHLQIIVAAFTGYVLCLYYCSSLGYIYVCENVYTRRCPNVESSCFFSFRLDKQVQLTLIHCESRKYFDWFCISVLFSIFFRICSFNWTSLSMIVRGDSFKWCYQDFDKNSTSECRRFVKIWWNQKNRIRSNNHLIRHLFITSWRNRTNLQFPNEIFSFHVRLGHYMKINEILNKILSIFREKNNNKKNKEYMKGRNNMMMMMRESYKN